MRTLIFFFNMFSLTSGYSYLTCKNFGKSDGAGVNGLKNLFKLGKRYTAMI